MDFGKRRDANRAKIRPSREVAVPCTDWVDDTADRTEALDAR
jgi:hypothetical protein